MRTKMTKIIGQITKSNDPYMPKGVDCTIWLKNGKVVSAHRVSDGAGTYANRSDKIEFIEVA